CVLVSGPAQAPPRYPVPTSPRLPHPYHLPLAPILILAGPSPAGLRVGVDVTGRARPPAGGGGAGGDSRGTLRGSPPAAPTSQFFLRSNSIPFLSPRSVFPVLTPWKRGTGVGAGFAEGLERSASARVRAIGAKRIRQSLPLLLHAHPPGSFEGRWPFPGPPVANSLLTQAWDTGPGGKLLFPHSGVGHGGHYGLHKVFSIAVFGPIVNEGYVNADSDPSCAASSTATRVPAASAVALGLGAFLACAAFLLLDVHFQQISSVRDRRRAVLLDLGFSGLWSFLWFVGFCFLTNQWQRTAPGPGTTQAGDAARAPIAFSSFSILSWAALTVKALQRFRLGTDMSLFATEQLGAGAGQTYPGYPVGSGVEGTETYQSPPFTETLDTSPKGYQVPAY
ncbi:synaptogyrin-3, partial [Balaenoptera musculus]|uniref:Synaptogyrin-3 n=1 Tax=Balaenoptera musculus TaxID=9771 RepID=A0A8B8VCM7_BALMU